MVVETGLSGAAVHLVEELVLQLVDVPDGLQDDVQLGDALLLGDGGHETLEAAELYLSLFAALGDGGALDAAQGVGGGGRGGHRGRRRCRRRRRRRRGLHDHLGTVMSRVFFDNLSHLRGRNVNWRGRVVRKRMAACVRACVRVCHRPSERVSERTP